MTGKDSVRMKKRKPLPRSELLDLIVLKVQDLIDETEDPTKLNALAMTLINIEKNDRDERVAIKENIVPNLTDDELEAELARTESDK